MYLFVKLKEFPAWKLRAWSDFSESWVGAIRKRDLRNHRARFRFLPNTYFIHTTDKFHFYRGHKMRKLPPKIVCIALNPSWTWILVRWIPSQSVYLSKPFLRSYNPRNFHSTFTYIQLSGYHCLLNQLSLVFLSFLSGKLRWFKLVEQAPNFAFSGRFKQLLIDVFYV